MFTQISTLVVVAAGVICFLTDQSKAQGCAAQSVVNLRLDAYHNLTWSLRPDEPCEVSEYLVYIFHPDQPAEHAFTVKETSVDVSFLEVCEEWIFAVVPVSGNLMGAERRLTDKIPIPTDADLSISNILITYDESIPHTNLHWNLTNKRFEKCSLRYRVTLEVDGSPIIADIYVNEKIVPLDFLPACYTYQIGVRAINTAWPTIEGPLKSESLEVPGRPQNPPVLLDSQIGATWANVSYRIESIVRNPCRVNQLLLEVEQWAMYPVNLSNEGERLPVNVSVDHLKPNTTYVLKAYVRNTAGLSKPRDYEIHTLDSDFEDASQLNKEELARID